MTLKEETENEQIGPQEKKIVFTGQDKRTIIAMVIVAIGFSIRGGAFPGCVFATLLQIAASFIYGFGLVFLFIGMTKKTFKYNPTKVQIIKWVVTLAAIFAFSEMLHEGYLMLTGQLPPVK